MPALRVLVQRQLGFRLDSPQYFQIVQPELDWLQQLDSIPPVLVMLSEMRPQQQEMPLRR